MMISPKKTGCFSFVFAILVIAEFISLPARADSFIDDKLRRLVYTLTSGKSPDKMLQIQRPALLRAFYEKNQFTLQWYSLPGDTSKRKAWCIVVRDAWKYVLKPASYHFSQLEEINRNIHLRTKDDTLAGELIFTDAALSFLHDVAYGEGPPYLRYNGISYTPDCFDLISFLQLAIEKNSFEQSISSIEPNGNKYLALKAEYLRLHTITQQPGFHEIMVPDKDLKWSNQNLVMKLRQLEYMADTDSTEDQLLKSLKKLQSAHNLLGQPEINIYCSAILNEPISKKLQKLEWNIQWFRWLNCIQNLYSGQYRCQSFMVL